MASQHQFGGAWTEEKLDRVRKYLAAYTTIFTQNARAATLRTIYVDAFAGTGYRTASSQHTSTALPLFADEDATSLQQGSAASALETEPPFDHYLFIEQVAERVVALQQLRQHFPHRAQQITIIHDNANTFLRQWCRETDWRTHRAVVFLDPYGMEVAWATIEAIAQTHAIDLWLLFPLGQAVNRLLTRHGPPEEAWAQRLTRMFGTAAWKDAFYRPPTQGTLFSAEATPSKKTPILTRLVPSSCSALKPSLRKSSKSRYHCVTRKMSPSICSVLPQEIPKERQQRCESRVTS